MKHKLPLLRREYKRMGKYKREHKKHKRKNGRIRTWFYRKKQVAGTLLYDIAANSSFQKAVGCHRFFILPFR